MAPDKRHDDEQPRNDEKNPFIAFRRHVDAQLNTLFGSVFSLPSSIYNQGQDHGRMWSQHRHDRLRQMDKEEEEAASGGEKEWEEAMRDFEDSEREVKEWYDKVLKQITQRRDEHLESGMGFGDMERGMKAVVEPEGANTCPYLPSKERQEESLPENEGNKEQGCNHPSRWLCERDYPQSRFLDWVWTGWGGPSTTPNMLWHRGHKQDEKLSGTAAKITEGSDAKPGPTLSLDDPRVQQAIATGQCPSLEDTEAAPSSGRLPLLMFLLLDKNSPLQLEKDADLGMFGTQWRDAYEDLMRVQSNEPLTTAEESAENEQLKPNHWLKRVLQSQKPSVDEQRVMARGPLEAVKHLMVGGDEEIGRAWENLRSQVLSEAFGDSSRLTELVERYGPRLSDKTSLPRPDRTVETGVDADESPEHELELFLKQNPADTVGTPLDFTKDSAFWKPISTQSSSSEHDNPDGTRTYRHTQVKTFEGGQEKTTEQISRWDTEGNMLSNVSSSRFTSASSPGANMLPNGWERDTTPDGVAYYIDHNTHRTSWQPPSSSSSTPTAPSPEEDLPTGWEKKVGREGKAYYIDHNTKSTTWRHPNEGFVLPKNRNEFEQLVNQRFREAGGKQREDRGSGERKGMGSGWFWRS